MTLCQQDRSVKKKLGAIWAQNYAQMDLFRIDQVV